MSYVLTSSRRQILTSPCELVREVLGEGVEGTFDGVVKAPFTLESAGISDLDALDKLNIEVIGENATAILGLVRAEGDRSWDEYAFAVAKIYAWAAEEAYRRDRTFGLAASPVDMFASVGLIRASVPVSDDRASSFEGMLWLGFSNFMVARQALGAERAALLYWNAFESRRKGLSTKEG